MSLKNNKEIQLEFHFWLGDSVKLITDVNKEERLVTSIVIREGSIMYGLSVGDRAETMHHSFEIDDYKKKSSTIKGFGKTIEK